MRYLSSFLHLDINNRVAVTRFTFAPANLRRLHGQRIRTLVTRERIIRVTLNPVHLDGAAVLSGAVRDLSVYAGDKLLIYACGRSEEISQSSERVIE